MKLSLHKKIMEVGGGPQITGRYAPTNALLKPEFDPNQKHRARGLSDVYDEFTDPERLELDKINDISSSHPLGDGKQYPQEDGKDDLEARVIADRIIQGRAGKMKPPEKKGTLFRRTAEGKIIVPGLESEELKEQQRHMTETVKNIISSI